MTFKTRSRARGRWLSRTAARAVLSLALVAGSAQAVEVGEALSLHGFGTAGLGRSWRNDYLYANTEGSGQLLEAFLLISVRPTERLSLSTQFGFEGEKSRLEWAFGEWTFSDALKLRAGRSKLPFGLSREIMHVGTLRPFLTLPGSIYGPTELGAVSYNGVGLTGHVLTGSWALEYDAYAGRMDLEEISPLDLLEGEEPELEPLAAMGARLTVLPPVEGLRLMASGYGGRSLESIEPGDDAPVEASLGVGFSAEYLNERWLARAEYALSVDEQGEVAHAGYAELAYLFAGHWQPAVRLELSRTEASGLEGPPSLSRHRDIAVGLNYWFNRHFVLKLALHNVLGNRLAYPGDLSPELLEEQGLASRTYLGTFGAQFTF